MAVIAEATGRTMVNPARFEDRMNGHNDNRNARVPLGGPPHSFGLEEVAVWTRLSAICWWLDEYDRDILAAVCRVSVKTSRDGCEVAWFNTLGRLLSQIGLTPTTRAKVLQERGLLESNKGREDDDI